MKTLYRNLSEGWANRRERIVWALKQLLPLKYRTHYREAGELHYTEWRMWFGRCFSIRDRVLA